jgi:hypothetical protein
MNDYMTKPLLLEQLVKTTTFGQKIMARQPTVGFTP